MTTETHCRSCGAHLQADDRFCERCGTAVGSGPAPGRSQSAALLTAEPITEVAGAALEPGPAPENAVATPESISAGFGVRLLAMLIDGLLIFVIGAVISAVFAESVSWLISIAVDLCAFTYFWTTTGQTPGKAVVGLRVVSAESGGALDVRQAILRYVGDYVSGLPLLLGYFWVLWDPKHEAWHDKIAKTKVISTKQPVLNTLGR